MAFDDRRKDFSKERITVVEVDLPFCSLTYGTAPCTAVKGTTGDQECFNTLASCQDPSNYDEETKTYRYCSKVSPIPTGLDAMPVVASVERAPSVVDVRGGLGVRASIVVTMDDPPHNDIGVDPYVSERDYDPEEQGSHFTKLRARNPFYASNPFRELSGYIVDGIYDPDNFQTRHYIIESMAASNGRVTFNAKDPLKLADSDRAQAPRPSVGQLDDDYGSAITAIKLTPAGVHTQYPATGFARIKSEVVAFTNDGDDDFTITRAQRNTEAEDLSEGDTFQLCLEYDAEQVHDIIEDLLTEYAGVDSDFIPDSEWAAEVNDFIPGLLSTLITEPTGVKTLLKELGEQAPHSLYWDERRQEIVLNAIKPAPFNATPLTDESSLMELVAQDEKDMRVSTVLVYFGQIDPTKRLDEADNYQQTYVRADVDSIANYGSARIKTIYSRWITNVNKAAAVLLASRIGRRFADVPRSINYMVDPKDISVWTGQSVDIVSRNIPDFTGAPQRTTFQITSVRELSDQYQYSAIEHNFSDPFGEDPDPDESLILLGGDINNVNIRDIYDSLFPAPDNDTIVKVIVEASATVGSTSSAEPAMDTGTWPEAMDPIKLEFRGNVLGKGGNAGAGEGGQNGDNGGNALNLQHDVDINNLAIIGAGGGGGGGADDSDGGIYDVFAQGGGGAGRENGFGHSNGTDFEGGIGQFTIGGPFGANFAQGGNGGDLGQAGQGGQAGAHLGTGGQPGLAIKANGKTITYTEEGTIIGDVEA